MHKTRVGDRRLRSTLRNFGPALTSSPEALSALDDNLRWLAALLSPIRDGDILARRLKAEVAELPPERVLGPVVIEIEETLATERAAAIREWQQARSDQRYTMTMATLAGWLVEVPLAEDQLDGAQGARRRRSARRDGG